MEAVIRYTTRDITPELINTKEFWQDIYEEYYSGTFVYLCATSPNFYAAWNNIETKEIIIQWAKEVETTLFRTGWEYLFITNDEYIGLFYPQTADRRKVRLDFLRHVLQKFDTQLNTK